MAREYRRHVAAGVVNANGVTVSDVVLERLVDVLIDSIPTRLSYVPTEATGMCRLNNPHHTMHRQPGMWLVLVERRVE